MHLGANLITDATGKKLVSSKCEVQSVVMHAVRLKPFPSHIL